MLQLLRRVPLAYADARTWRALAHVVTGGPVALVAATLFTVGVASGLLSLVLIGLPLFCFALVGCRLLAWLERCRALVVDANPIGASYHATTGLPVSGKVRVLVTDPATWRDVLWTAVMAPVGLVSLAATIAGAGLSVMLVASPLWIPITSSRRAAVGAIAIVLGLIGWTVGPWVNLAAYRRDPAAFSAALHEYEAHCLSHYGRPTPDSSLAPQAWARSQDTRNGQACLPTSVLSGMEIRQSG
jgi:hypothetical protein